MRFYLNCIAIGAIFLTLGGCFKLDLPDSSIGGIAFGVSGKMDNNPFYIGLDSFDYEFTTGTTSSMDLSVFQGSFSSFDSRNWELNFQIRNNQSGNSFDSAYWSMPGNLPFYSSGMTSVTSFIPVQYGLFSTGGDLDASKTKIQPGNIEILGSQNTVNLPAGNNYTFCTEYKDDLGEGKFCCLLRPEANIPVLGVDFGISALSLNDTPLTAFLYGDDTVQGNYEWSTGASGNSIIINSPGTYAVTFTDINGNKVSHEKKVAYNITNTGFQAAGVYPDMSLGTVFQAPNPDILSTVEINLKDEEGKVYSSGNQSQPSSSYFEVEEVRFIEPDFFRLQRVMALKVKFRCKLVAPDSEAKELTEMKGWIGVGIN